MTPDVLRNLAAADLEHDQEFMLLKTADQTKVRQAMARGRVNDGTRESTIPVTGISSPSILSKNGEGEEIFVLQSPWWLISASHLTPFWNKAQDRDIRGH